MPITGDHIVLRGLFSGVSRGTERLVLRGDVPPAEYARMRAPMQEGEFPFPVKYGYGFVGVAVDGPESVLNRRFMALAPHQETVVLPIDAAIPLPGNLPSRRAVLAANMETALNVVWDAGVTAGDRVLIAGAGVVGLLIAHIVARIPGVEATIADINPARAGIAGVLGTAFVEPPGGPEDVDVAINASASAEGLRYLLGKAGLEARVVEASWHGVRDVSLPLGEAFHAKRLSIVSSQVGRLPSARQARWTHRRRLGKALDLLAAAPELDALITHETPLSEAPRRLPALIESDADALCIAIRYVSGES